MGALVAFAGGFLVRLVLPVEQAWLAWTVAAACLALAVLFALLDRSALPATRVEGAAALETMDATGQWAQAFLRSAIVLAAFALGLLLGEAIGLDRP